MRFVPLSDAQYFEVASYATDTSDRLDWEFAFRVAQAGAATLAELAGTTM
ncbi:MAG: hypothetical protein N838_09475 [Thiohalocapsa sp. PB-PSB1]|nr:MAG: hypothetical protein N838_02275 [Thiohalocapsa sp. PB-PSB1]QQO53548.1 MAG: hypothetical protein N838_09475 [Thiohalocapsa sp. PB-PSB1]